MQKHKSEASMAHRIESQLGRRQKALSNKAILKVIRQAAIGQGFTLCQSTTASALMMTALVLLQIIPERQQTQLHLQPALHSMDVAAKNKLQVGVRSCSRLAAHNMVFCCAGIMLPKPQVATTNPSHVI